MSEETDNRLRKAEQNIGILTNEVTNLKQELQYKDEQHRLGCPFLLWRQETKGRYATLIVTCVSVLLFFLGSLGTLQINKVSSEDFRDFKKEVAESQIRRDERIATMYEANQQMFKELMEELTELKVTLTSLTSTLQNKKK